MDGFCSCYFDSTHEGLCLRFVIGDSLLRQLQVALYQALRQRPSWMTMQFGRKARSQQRITPAALEDEDTNDDADEGQRGAFLPRAGPRFDNEWNDR